MKRTLAALAVLSLFVAGFALAADTGQHYKPSTCGGDPCVLVSYDDGTGADPVDLQPNGDTIGSYDGGFVTGLGPQAGISLVGLKGFTVTVKLRGTGIDAGGTFTAGTLKAWLYNPASASWGRANDLDLTVVVSQAEQSFPGFEVPAQAGRVLFVPYGLGQPSDIYIIGKR